MKLYKNASGKQVIKLSKQEWLSIGDKAGWIKKAQGLPTQMSKRESDKAQRRADYWKNILIKAWDWIIKDAATSSDPGIMELLSAIPRPPKIDPNYVGRGAIDSRPKPNAGAGQSERQRFNDAVNTLKDSIMSVESGEDLAYPDVTSDMIDKVMSAAEAQLDSLHN